MKLTFTLVFSDLLT